MKNVPMRYSVASYEDVPKEITKVFEKMVETRRGIYIHGGVGSGKTHIAYALFKNVKEVLKLERDPLFWNTTELLAEIKEDFDRRYDSKHHIDEELMTARVVLFLDDIGAEKPTDWVQETFYRILNGRYERMLPTVFTSNLTIAQLAERMGDRIASRIVETCDIVHLKGEDKRFKNIKKLTA